jgi:hypothetical protein
MMVTGQAESRLVRSYSSTSSSKDILNNLVNRKVGPII